MTITVLDGVTGNSSFDIISYLEGLDDSRIPRMDYCIKNSKHKALNFMTTNEVGTTIIVKEDRDIEVIDLNSTSIWRTCGSNKCIKVALNHILENLVITYEMKYGALLTVDLICN